MLRSIGTTVAALVVILAVTRSLLAEDQPKPKPYPLDVCLVTDEKLGEMGDPHVITYQGREIKFCCSHCEKEFREEPAKYLKKLDKAAKATSKPTTRPTTKPADAPKPVEP